MSKSSDRHDAHMRLEGLDIEVYNLGNGPVEVVTTPPGGMLKVRNIYYNPQNNKFLFEYDDEL